jgi:2-polyprenyl-6-hydroxyphenyl methylase/3-demethylubiquinone-9 3-methyltransferase
MAVDNTLYDATGDIWWRPEQPLASIRTSLNPARLEYLHDVMDESGLDFAGLRVLDVGCGGGLLAEELAQLGCLASGVDPSPGSIATAERHAAASGLTIMYRVGQGEALPYPAESFDLVTCVDVLEHVADVGEVLAEIARVLRPGGILVYDTINRTRLSDLVMIRLAQQFPATRWMPRDLHAADHFIRPAEMVTALERAGLDSQGLTGMKPNANPLQLVRLMRGVHGGQLTPEEFGRRTRMVLSPDTSILYIGHAAKPLGASSDAGHWACR